MSRLCEMSSSTPIRDMMVHGVGGADKLEAMTKDACKRQPDTLEGVIAELRELECDRLVRLADEEDELMESLKLIRDGLRRKQQRGRELEANGVTLELIRRYRKDYADTDWGC